MAALPDDFTLLQVIPDLETGGAEQTTLDIATAVVRAGGRALVASRGGRMVARLEAAGGHFIPMPVHSKNPLIMAANRRRLIDLIRRERVSLVHVRSRAPAFAAFSAAKATNIPALATYHGLYGGGSAPKRWYNAVMTRGPVVIANSAFTREHVIAEHGIAPDKVIAIPRGVDLERFDPAKVDAGRLDAVRAAWGLAEGDARVKFLLAGRLTRWKGQALLIEAGARLKARGEAGFLILLAGDDQGRRGYRAALEDAVREANLQDSVRLVGHCDDMPAAYLIADVACAPSLKPEAFGRTAVEPQVLERPVIAADHGGARETVVSGQTGWLVPPGDADAWANAMAEAIAAGPDERAAMGRAGALRTRRLYSVDAMCEATFEVYSGLVRERP